MKEIKQKIQNFLNKINSKKENYSKDGIKPIRDWGVVLSISFLFTLLLSVFSYYFYIETDQGEFFNSDNNEALKTVTIDNNLLKKTVDDFSFRQKNILNFRQNRIIPSDPSI